jgi:hypothetical protein
MALTADQLAAARIVAEGLEFLMDEWVPELERPALRRLSPTLRLLLHQNEYGKGWSALGLPRQPYISATSLDALLGTIDRRLVKLAFAPAGYAVSAALSIGRTKIRMFVPGDPPPKDSVVVSIQRADFMLGQVIIVVPLELQNLAAADPDEAVKEEINRCQGDRVVRGMTLPAFLASPAALILDQPVTRRDIIHFVADKDGGAHIDPTRNRKSDERLKLLDGDQGIYSPTSGTAAALPYIELLSIAEALAESSDAARFRDEFASVERTATRRS